MSIDINSVESILKKVKDIEKLLT